MRTRPARQLDLTDSFLPAAPANDFLDRLDALVDWEPIRRELEGMFTATTGRLPQPPLAVFKMLLLQNFYGLSDPQCEALVLDRLSWRKFTGLALTDRVPDETTLVRFRQRLIEHGLHQKLLALVNAQLAAKGLIVREVTLVDATLVQAARRAPTQGAPGGWRRGCRLHRQSRTTALWLQSACGRRPEAHADPQGGLECRQRA